MYTGVSEGEQPFLKDVFRIVVRRLWIIVVMVLVFVGAAVGFSLWQTPEYEASAEVLVGQRPDGDSQQQPLSSSVTGLQQLTLTMTEAINSRPVAEEVIQQQGLDLSAEALLGNLTVEQVPETQFIELTYRSTDPQNAKDVVNSIGDVSSRRISEASASAGNITANVYEYAIVPETPVSPDPVRNGLLALGLGLMFGVGLTFLMEYLDDSWRSPEEVEQISGLATFGIIPEFEAVKVKKKKG